MASSPSRAGRSGNHLSLVGVVHRDPGGRAKLAGLLDELRPDLISLQISPYAIRWRRARGAELADRLARQTALAAARLGLDRGRALAHGAIQTVAAQLRLPFEFVAAREFQRRAGGRICLVEDSAGSRRWLAEMAAEVLTVDNLVQLLMTPDVSLAARCRGAWQRTRWAVGQSDPAESDTALATAIRQVHQRFRPRRHLHVCGWVHLTALNQRLADLEPRSGLLDEAEGPGVQTCQDDRPRIDKRGPTHSPWVGPVKTNVENSPF